MVYSGFSRGIHWPKFIANNKTFQYDGIMLTVSASIATRYQHQSGDGEVKVKQFDQVSSDGHQMSLAEGFSAQ